MNSHTEPGHPCVTSRGSAPSWGERTWRKWTFCPSMVVVNCGNEFSRASAARQSNDVRQYSHSRCRVVISVP